MRSRNHCCSWKVIYVTYCKCAFLALVYPACKTHEPFYIAFCDISGSTALISLISYTARFRRKVIDIKYLFWFSLQLLTEAFLIPRKIRRYVIINVYSFSCKVPLFLSDYRQTLIFSTEFLKITPCTFS